MLKKRLSTLKSTFFNSRSGKVSDQLRKRLLENGFFDASWYVKAYPEVSSKRRWKNDPLQHFMTVGSDKSYSPGVWFNSEWYLSHNPDVEQAAVNPLVHYLYYGMNEGRFRSEKVLLNPSIPENTFIALGKQQLQFRLPVIADSNVFSISLLYQQYQAVTIGKPCGIIKVRVADKKGNEIAKNVTGLKWSDMFNCWYRYLTQHSAEHLKSDHFNFSVPKNALYCDVEIASWNNAALEVRNRMTIATPRVVESLPRKVNSPAPVERLVKKASQLKVAFIADEFTYNSFKDEFEAITFEPGNWQEVFEQHQPDLFFCESAWSGIDPVKRPWKGKVYASRNFAKENRIALLDILNYCRKMHIPTLFWNKEDPTHYPDRVHDFVKTASLFDYVFTSAEECVPLYKKDYGLKNVFALPFATNPRLFNPFNAGQRSNKVVFAGSWYANHTERSRLMEEILDNLVIQGFDLEIYDRYFADDDPLHEWPERFKEFIKPGLPHNRMPEVYKSSQFGLNFNTVTTSSTMFARRVFELMSSNTLVISNYSKGVAEMFGDLVVFADRDPQRLSQLTPDFIERTKLSALKTIMRQHTYRQRWETILNSIGYEFIEETKSLAVVIPVSSHEQAKQAISVFEQKFGGNKENHLLLLIERDVAELEVAKFYQQYNRFGITVVSESFVINHALDGKFNPVDSDNMLYFNLTNEPAYDWVEDASLYLSYLPDAVFSNSNVTSDLFGEIDVTEKDLFMCSGKNAVDNLQSISKLRALRAFVI